jgi:hypothetical protein
MACLCESYFFIASSSSFTPFTLPSLKRILTHTILTHTKSVRGRVPSPTTSPTDPIPRRPSDSWPPLHTAPNQCVVGRRGWATGAGLRFCGRHRPADCVLKYHARCRHDKCDKVCQHVARLHAHVGRPKRAGVPSVPACLANGLRCAAWSTWSTWSTWCTWSTCVATGRAWLAARQLWHLLSVLMQPYCLA